MAEVIDMFSGDREKADVNWIDYLAIGIYFIVVLAVGIWSSKISKKNTVNDYFLAGREMHWIPVGASIYASNLGSEHFVGLTGSGASSGIGMVVFEYTAIYCVIILAWYFMPVYLSSNVSTMPQYLQERYGGQRIRVYLSLLALILYIFTKISANLYAGALFIRMLLNIDDIYLSVIILVVLSALFTITGGLTAVIWTDFMQIVLMIVGAIYLSITSISKVGGYENLAKNYRETGLPTSPLFQAFKNGCNGSIPENNCTSCSEITPYYLNLFRPINDPEIPWLGIAGVFISGMWYWCTDQVIVQRALSAKNLTHAKAGCILASGLKLLPLYLLIIPGMAARVLWPNEIGCSNPDYCEEVCGSRSGCTNMAYVYLVIRLMPQGATGLMVSVIIAALMSSLTSIFNSASTIFIIDIYVRFRKRATEFEQIIVGRLFVLFLVVVSVIWIPILESSQNSQLFQYIQSVTAYLAPPPCAVYIWSLFWWRTTEPAAFWSLVIGLVIGLTRFVLEYAYQAPICGSTDHDPRPLILSKVHYTHFGLILFVISSILIVVISLATSRINRRHLHRLTYSTRHSEEVREEIDRSDEAAKDNSGTGTPSSSSLLAHKWVAILCCAQGVAKHRVSNESVESLESIEKPSAEVMAKLHASAARDDPKYEYLVNLATVASIVACSFYWGYYA